MTFHLSLLPGVALAGIAYLVGERVAQRLGILERLFIPIPLLGGLMFAGAFAVLRQAGVVVHVPHRGTAVEFLSALLTTNVGLHLTPKVLRAGAPVFALFLLLGAALYFVQLAATLPLASLLSHTTTTTNTTTTAPPKVTGRGDVLRTALVMGPLSYVGSPFRLNPPTQSNQLAELFRSNPGQLSEVSVGMMMMGLLVGTAATVVFAGFAIDGPAARIGPGADKTAPGPIPRSPLRRRAPRSSIWSFGERQTTLLVLMLSIISIAFVVQRAMLHVWPGLVRDDVPVVVISYILGGAVRLGLHLWSARIFPEDTLSVLLLGPTMSLVLTYSAMAVPLHRLGALTMPMIIGGLAAIGASLFMARIALPLLRRAAGRYYGSVIATAFLAITMGWGPVGMAFLRRSTGLRGPVEPMPVILPLNAFYLYPWLVILLTRLLLG